MMARFQIRTLMVFLAILFMPHGAWAVNYSITVAGTTITDVNASDVFRDGTVSFTPATATTPNTLRLDNYRKTDAHTEIVSGLDNLTIVFSGSNMLGRNSTNYGIIRSTVPSAVLTLKGIPGADVPSTIDLESFNDRSPIEGFQRVDLDGAYLVSFQPSWYGVFKDWSQTEKKGYVTGDGPLHGMSITTEVCYPLWVSDDGYNIYQVTAANSVVGGSSFSVNGSTNTLKLNNANLARIVSGFDNLTIDLVGDNNLVNLYDTATAVRSINKDAELTFTKSGSSGSLALQNVSSGIYSVISGFKSIAYNGLYLNTSVPPRYKSKDVSGNNTIVTYSLVNALDDNVIHSATINTTETYPLWVNGLQVTSANAGSIGNVNPGAPAGIGISENVAGKGCSVKYASGVLEFDNVHLSASNNAIVSDLANLTVKIKGLNYFNGVNNYFTSISGGSLTFSGDGEDAELEMVNHTGFIGFGTIDYDKVYFGDQKGLGYIKYLKAPTMWGTDGTVGLDVKFQGDDVNGVTYWYSIDYAGSTPDVSNTQLSTTVSSVGGTNVQMGTVTMSDPGVVTAYAKYNYTGGVNSSTQGVTKTGKYFSFAEKEVTTPYKSSINAPNIVPDLPSGATVTYYTAMAATAPVNSINSSTGVVTINGLTTSPDIFGATFSDPLNHDDYTILNSLSGQTDLSLGTFKLTVTAKSLDADMVTLSPTSFTYTGVAQAPTVTVKDGGKTLTQGTDYTLTNAGGTAAGDYSVTVVGAGNYSGTISKTYTIAKAAAAINYATASISKNVGEAAFINPLSNTGDGAVSYTSSNTAVATVNATTGEVTIVGPGSTTVTATVADGANYTYATKSATYTLTVNKIVGSISYTVTSIAKTFGDAAFTNPLALTGDGTVSYSSSNTAVATVNATSGEVTIVGSGSATITATVTDGTTYTYSTKTATYTLSVGTAAMIVSATGYTGAYDGLAHGITVTAPAGATVKYGTSAGTYNLNASPTYTNAGSYTVYYEVTKANYTTVTGSAVVNISKASASISYATASVGKTFGDVPFTNSLTNTGDGAVTYSSSNTNVATVNATSGEVTIVGNGSTTITATVTDGTNYTYAAKTATYTLSVGTAAMTVNATGYTGAYDGQAHGITVTAPAGATVKYGTSAGTYNLNASPTYTNAGSYTVYYEVTKANYTTVTGSAVVNISKASASISYATASVGKTFGDVPFTNSLTNTGDGAVTYSSSNTNVATVNATSGEVTIVGNGSTTITATVTDGTNYTYAAKTATYTLSVGTAAMTVSATGYTGAYDGQAHGITVTAPAGATVKYGTSAGTYNLNASPTYTNAGSYTVYYEVTKANYTTVTGSAVVNISKASASISYATASVGKTFGDVPFTNSLTNTGDGAVTYSSSNTNVATVNATSGEVTIVGNGSTTITATVTDGTNYTYAAKTATYTLSVGTAAMTVNATGYTGAYDGQAHGITVTAPAGATVKYGETAGTYNLNASPTYTNAGTYTVYYQVTKTGFDTATGSATVTITKVDPTVKYVNYEFTAKIGEPFDPPYLTLEPSDLAVTYYSADKDIATVDAQTGEVTLVAPGKVNIYATFDGDENYNSASDYYILTVLQRDIEPIDEDVTIMMNDDNFLYTDDEGNKKEVRLDNAVIYDILFTLNISGDPSESDGYDETEQCVVLNHPMRENEVNRIITKGLVPGSDEYADEYAGLTFKVPAGTGYVIIDSRTDGDYQMMVKIGNLAPVAFNHTGREKDSVLYECNVPTWVYVYNGGTVSNARIAVDHRAKKQKGHVKIYSVTRSSAKSSGIERINVDALESERWYDLQGNRIQRPTRKGLYILQGQKVVVK